MEKLPNGKIGWEGALNPAWTQPVAGFPQELRADLKTKDPICYPNTKTSPHPSSPYGLAV